MNDDLTPSGERAVRLAIEVAALRAKIARVEALADEWQRDEGRGWISTCGDDLADALNDTGARLAALAKERPSCNWPRCNTTRLGKCFAWCKCRCHNGGRA